MENYRTITIDLSKADGRPVKPINCVNNGPAGSIIRDTSNFKRYEALKIPYARTHDASFCADYGWEFSVDVHRIFRNFDADETLPESYAFASTDEYIRRIQEAGTETFYRLGSNIEHGERNGTYPPKDFAKWARICEHIIRHYNEGWADGFHYDIRYWEIWNEPECRNADGTNPCWQGTPEEFADLFAITAKHLKAQFPGLKIGGPALSSVWSSGSAHILDEIVSRQAPMDFFSYHWYGCEPKKLEQTMGQAAEVAKRFPGAELILNEWNYIRGWLAEEWKYSLRTEKNLKGSSFIGACMAVAQAGPLDMLMYYDARPCGMNGLFDTDTLNPLKGYYTFLAARDVKQLPEYVPTVVDHEGGLYSIASTNGSEAAAMITYYKEEDDQETQLVKFDFRNLRHEEPVIAKLYLLDDRHDLVLTREEIFTSENFSIYHPIKEYDTILIKIEKG